MSNENNEITSIHSVFELYIKEAVCRKQTTLEVSALDNEFINKVKLMMDKATVSLSIKDDVMDMLKKHNKKRKKYDLSLLSSDKFNGIDINEGYKLKQDEIDEINVDIKKLNAHYNKNVQKIIDYFEKMPTVPYIEHPKKSTVSLIFTITFALTITISWHLFKPIFEKFEPTQVYLVEELREYDVAKPSIVETSEIRESSEIKDLNSVRKISFKNEERDFNIVQLHYEAKLENEVLGKPYMLDNLDENDIKPEYVLTKSKYNKISKPASSNKIMDFLNNSTQNERIKTVKQKLESFNYYVIKDNIESEDYKTLYGQKENAVYFTSSDNANIWIFNTYYEVLRIIGVSKPFLITNLLITDGSSSSVDLEQTLYEFVDENIRNTYAVDGDIDAFAYAVSQNTIYTKKEVIDLINYYDDNYFDIDFDVQNELFEKLKKQEKNILKWLKKRVKDSSATQTTLFVENEPTTIPSETKVTVTQIQR